MSVFLRKDGRWCSKRLENGKARYAYFHSESEARDFESEQGGLQSTEEVHTLGSLAILYGKSRNIHPDSARKIVFLLAGSESSSGKHVEGPAEFLRDKEVERLTRMDLEKMRDNFRKRGTGNSTINKMQAYIRAILAWGVEQQIIAINPWANFKRLPSRRRIPTANLAHFKLIIAVSPAWLQWAFATAYALALRWGQVELFSLQWSAFNWKRKTISLIQGKSGRIKVVVPPDWYMEAAHKRFEEDMRAGIPLVCHRNGRRVITYNRAWDSALKRAGLRGMDIRPYDLRHVAASEMLAAGADLAAVAAQMGHASIQTTATTYAHVTQGGQEKAAALMPVLESVQIKK